MEKQGLNELAAVVHENAVAHGWWEQERELPEILMLCVSELAEALEEYRSGRPVLYFPCNAGGVCCEEDGSAHCGSRPYNPENPDAPCSAQSKKPEGVSVELADCMIRILDYCGHAGIDIEEAIRIKTLSDASTNTTKPAHIVTAGRNVDRGSGAAGIALCK